MSGINESRWPSLTVMIPSLGRDERLQATARDLARQDYPDWECVIVLQGQASEAQVSRLRAILGERLRVFHADEANASLARNIGLLEARSEVVLFLDDDVVIADPDFLRHHAGHYRAPEVPGVVGQVLGPDRAVRDERHPWSHHPRNGWLYFPSNFNHPAHVRNGTSCNLSVRKEWALAVGGMDAQFEKGAHREESDFCLRLTDRYGLLVFDPKASLVHLGEPSGGCRNWGMNSGVHPLHHVAGEWYFILKGIRGGQILWRDLPHHLFALIRRQILNRPNLQSLRSLWRASRRSLEGLRAALGKLRAGPRPVGTVRRDRYRSW
jgi:glycosyltransferase involved in cell wall biosynthesis